jgi:hypothetical protein
LVSIFDDVAFVFTVETMLGNEPSSSESFIAFTLARGGDYRSIALDQYHTLKSMAVNQPNWAMQFYAPGTAEESESTCSLIRIAAKGVHPVWFPAEDRCPQLWADWVISGTNYSSGYLQYLADRYVVP